MNSNNGAISGVTQTDGSFGVTVTLTDGSQQTATAQFPLRVERLIPILEIVTPSVPPGVVGTPYSASFSARGGTPGYSFSLAAGSLPGGLALTGDGGLSGTPASAGQFPFTVKVTDAAAATATTAFVLVVAPAALTITGSVSDTQVGSAVSAQFGATGGVPPYTFTVSGSIPSGASFSSGTLSGTANSPGAFQFTVVATDSRGIVASKTFTITVTVNPLKLTGTAGNGQVGVTYSAQFGATGGAAPYTFSAGGLPPGVQLSGASLGGTPTAAGAFTVAVTVTDSTGANASASFAVEVAPAVLDGYHPRSPREPTAPVIRQASTPQAELPPTHGRRRALPTAWPPRRQER